MGKIIMFLIGVITAAIYIILYLVGNKKYQRVAAAVRDDVFPIKDIFVVGLLTLDIFKIKPEIKSSKTRRKYTELFGKQYVEFYSMITVASVISYVAMFIPVAFFFGAMADMVEMIFLILIISVLLPVYVIISIDDKIKNQRNEILMDYPNVLSKIALLTNAGMTLREAWADVAKSGNTKLYIEMRNVITLINNGTPEIRAYEELAESCRVNEIKKFVSVICQNQKGSSELVYIMKELSVEAWNAKKTVAKMKGDSAQTKLMIPLLISFVGILAMIMVPIVANMNLGI